jgi:hypothetical protein
MLCKIRLVTNDVYKLGLRSLDFSLLCSLWLRGNGRAMEQEVRRRPITSEPQVCALSFDAT